MAMRVHDSVSPAVGGAAVARRESDACAISSAAGTGPSRPSAASRSRRARRSATTLSPTELTAAIAAIRLGLLRERTRAAEQAYGAGRSLCPVHSLRGAELSVVCHVAVYPQRRGQAETADLRGLARAAAARCHGSCNGMRHTHRDTVTGPAFPAPVTISRRTFGSAPSTPAASGHRD